ncbi:MAG: non-hydrolyzing UDP-N-acetylglucosamine 2-epimerase [bacterium]
MRLVTVIGARPQFVKAAAVSRELARLEQVREILVHTGQHYDYEMSAVFFKELGLRAPQYNLEVGSKPHGEQTAEILAKLELILLKEKPAGVIVYGDTNSTLAGALCASKLHIPVAHVEAGLRSWNRQMPEEINRVVADHVADILFCPTATAVRNLEAEGIQRGVFNVGDVMLDAALIFGNDSAVKKAPLASGVLQRYGLAAKQYFLITIHRAENTDDPDRLQLLLELLLELRAPAIFPMHPRLGKLLIKSRRLRKLRLQLEAKTDLQMVQPVSYIEMLALEKNASAIITDSGGVQKEAFFFQTPCITLRQETEWIETLADGFNALVGADKKKFLRAISQLDKIRAHLAGQKKPEGFALFGGGKASARIARILTRVWR